MIPATISDGFLLALESHMRRHGQGRHLSATVLELEGAPDESFLSETAQRLATLHPLLNAKIKRAGDFRCYWHPGTPIPVPYTIHPSSKLDALILVLIEHSIIDIFKDGPNLELHALNMENNQWALIVIWPHALFDAVGLEKLLAEFDKSSSPPVEDWGETAKVPDSVRDQWAKAKPMVEEYRQLSAFRIRSFKKSGNAGKPCFEILRFDASQTQAIQKKMASTAGELLMLPYFASCAARAVRSVLQKRYPDEIHPIFLSLPVQRISSPDKRPLFQNHMITYAMILEAEELNELKSATRALFGKYGKCMRRKLPDAMDALMKLMERYPSRFYLKPAYHYMKGEICSLFHSHTGQFAAGLDQVFGCSIRNAYHVPTVSSPPGIGIFFSESRGQLTCTLSWREGTLEPKELDTLRETLLTDLTGSPTVRSFS